MFVDPVVTLVDLERAPADGRQVLNEDLRLASVGISLMVFRPGQRWRIHTHRDQEEVYVVLAGELTLLVEEPDGRIQEIAIGVDQVARVPPKVRRQIINPGPGIARFLAVGARGIHERGDAAAWHSWEDPGDGLAPQDVPLPSDLPV